MRILLHLLFVLATYSASAQVFAGFGIDYSAATAERLHASTRSFTELGYQYKRWTASALLRSAPGVVEWTKPDWLGGGRISYQSYEIPTDSLPFPALKKADFHVVLSGQWTQSDPSRLRSEHLGAYNVDHWTREIYQFQFNKHTFWVGTGVQGRLGSWSLLAEVQLAPWSNLDTWVYRSHLYSDGVELVQEDYYYYEKFMRIRGALTLRKHLGF